MVVTRLRGKRQRALLLGFEQPHVSIAITAWSRGLEKRDLFLLERSGSPFAVAQQRRRKRGAWPSRFASLLPTGYSGVLCGQIMDMNRSTIACGPSNHGVRFAETARGMATRRNFPVGSYSRRRLPSRRKITALFASHRRAAFSLPASSTG